MDREPAPQPEQTEAPGAGREARVKRLRRRAIAVSVACFALLWGVITVRMASGEDPVLGSRESPGEAGQANPSADGRPESSGEGELRQSPGEFPDRDRFDGPPDGGPEGFLFEEGGSGSVPGAPESGSGSESAPVRPESLRSGQS